MNDAIEAIYPATVPEPAVASVGGLEQYLPRFPRELSHHVGDEGHDNITRAGFAAHGVVAHARRTGLLCEQNGQIINDENLDTAVGDLLANLRHLCDAADLDWDELTHLAAQHHHDELRGHT